MLQLRKQLVVLYYYYSNVEWTIFLIINTSYTPIFQIDKILLSLKQFNSNSNRNITESIVDTYIKNYKK